MAGERKDNETDKAVIACNAFMRMGAGRSLVKLLAKRNKTQLKAISTDSLNTIQHWSSDFNWSERASVYDAEIEEKRNEARSKAIDDGLALDYERVTKLKRLASFLERQIYAGAKEVKTVVDVDDQDAALITTNPFPNVWLRDVKQIGGGEFAEKVELVRFNAPLIDQYRGVLDDLAKETGGRKVKTELTGKDGEALIPIAIVQPGYMDKLK